MTAFFPNFNSHQNISFSQIISKVTVQRIPTSSLMFPPNKQKHLENEEKTSQQHCIVRNGGCIMLSLKASKKKITKFPFSQSIEGNFMSNRKKKLLWMKKWRVVLNLLRKLIWNVIIKKNKSNRNHIYNRGN